MNTYHKDLFTITEIETKEIEIMQAYYRGLFTIKEVEIMAIKNFAHTMYSNKKYCIIKFKNGKLKYVNFDRIIIREE